jgi:NodT family efflux transporter outer membrane factor (OMF) lipoprotein
LKTDELPVRKHWKNSHFMKRSSVTPIFRFAEVVFVMFLSGCAAVGTNYIPPEIHSPPAWNTELLDGLSSMPSDPKTLAQWWTTLQDPVLVRLIQQAVEGNLDIQEARSRVREARARRRIEESALFPVIDSSADVTRSRSSENSGSGQENTLYSAGFDAGWELDVFGGTRRSIEAAGADLEASEADLQDVLVSLLAEVALNYAEVRIFQARLGVAEANIAAQEETYHLTRSRFEAGLSDELAVQQALYSLESTRSQLPTLRTGLDTAKNRLAVLLGKPPGSVHQELSEDRPIPVPPITIAVGVPADTLRRRPDIRRAERLLAGQTARIGVATADLYPKFRLAGSIGLESISSGDWLQWASRAWRIGPNISWNVFDAGAIRQNIEVQTALQQQALNRYHAAVLTALEEVENALKAYAEEQIRRDSLILATDAAQKAFLLAEDQYRAGLIDFIIVLIAQRSVLSLQDELATSEGAVTSNFVRLYKALGGGWSTLPPAETANDAYTRR